MSRSVYRASHVAHGNSHSVSSTWRFARRMSHLILRISHLVCRVSYSARRRSHVAPRNPHLAIRTSQNASVISHVVMGNAYFACVVSHVVMHTSHVVPHAPLVPPSPTWVARGSRWAGQSPCASPRACPMPRSDRTFRASLVACRASNAACLNLHLIIRSCYSACRTSYFAASVPYAVPCASWVAWGARPARQGHGMCPAARWGVWVCGFARRWRRSSDRSVSIC